MAVLFIALDQVSSRMAYKDRWESGDLNTKHYGVPHDPDQTMKPGKLMLISANGIKNLKKSQPNTLSEARARFSEAMKRRKLRETNQCRKSGPMLFQAPSLRLPPR